MYKISVPVMCRNINEENREAYLAEIKRFDAERVFLAIGSYQMDEIKRADALAQLKENCKFFKNNGFEVGAWFWALQFEEGMNFTSIKTLKGDSSKNFACPGDKSFIEAFKKVIKDVANTGVVMEILTGLAHRDGYCVIVVTHDMEVAEAADEVYRIKDGSITKMK